MRCLQDPYCTSSTNQEIKVNSLQASIKQRFSKIPKESYYDVIAFYHHYQDAIQSMSFTEYAEIKINLLSALFHLERYYSFTKYCDQFLAELLNEEEFSSLHKSYYEQALRYKQLFYAQNHQYEQSHNLLRSLSKLNPINKVYKREWKNSLIYFHLQKMEKWYSLIVILMLLTIVSTAVQLLYVRAFYPQWSLFIETFRNTAFISGLLCLIAVYSACTLKAIKEMRS